MRWSVIRSATRPGRFAYLAGYEPRFGQRDVAAFVLLPGKRYALVLYAYWDLADLHTWTPDVHITRDLGATLRELLPTSARRIGVAGYSFFPAPVASALADRMLVDATSLLLEVDDGDAAPPRQDVLRPDVPADEVDRPGQADAHRPQVRHRLALLLDHVEQQPDARSRPSSARWSAGSGIRRRAITSSGEPPIPTRTSRSPNAIAASRLCAGGERDQHGAAAVADARRELHHPAGVELLDHVRDGGGAQPREPGDLDLGQRTLLAEHLQDALAVRLPQGRLAPRRRLR